MSVLTHRKGKGTMVGMQSFCIKNDLLCGPMDDGTFKVIFSDATEISHTIVDGDFEPFRQECIVKLQSLGKTVVE